MDNYLKEGSHLIRRVVALPQNGSTLYLYTLFSENFTKFYRWLPDKTWEVIDLSSNLINVTALQGGTNVTVSGAGIPTDPYIISSEQDATGTPITPIIGITAVNVQEALEDVKTQIDTVATPDGSETIVTSSGATSVSGSGTIGDPYVVSSTAPDGSETIVQGTGATSVTGSGTVGDPYIVDSSADGSETIVQGAGDIEVTGTGTSGDPYIVDYNGIIPVPTLRYVKVTLTALQVQSGNTTPIVAISAQGVGTAIEVFSGTARLRYGTVQFSVNSDLFVQTASAPVGEAQYRTDPLFISQTTNSFVTLQRKADFIGNQVVENEDIVIVFDADQVQGDSEVDVYLTYRVIDL